MTWGVKTLSGFSVESESDEHRVEVGENHELVLHLGPLKVHEPVRIMAVVEEANRVGFSYGTLEGHPVAGEEAFIPERSAPGVITLVIRSLNRTPSGRWRVAYPLALLLQPWFRRRYSQALM